MKSIIAFAVFLIFAISAIDARECTTSGDMCDDCTTVATCIEREGGFNKIILMYCEADETCLAGSCTADVNPPCQNMPAFVCNDVGVFPDPYDCQKYHFCVEDPNGGLLGYETLCDGSWGYHAGTTYCQTSLSNNICSLYGEFPVETCESAGQSAAIRENQSIYYICAQYSSSDTRLYPFLFVCPHGGSYYDHSCPSSYTANNQKLMTRF